VRSGPEGYGDLDVWVQPVEGGEARRLTSQGYNYCKAPTWTPDGGEILFTVPSEGIRRVSVVGGEPEPILGVGQNAAFPSLQGNRMVFQQMTSQPRDLWRIPGRRGANPDRAPERLIASSSSDANADYSPVGRRIAFNSSRSGGASNVWTCDSDGANPVQLTRLERGGGTPRWSPDGRRIVFDSDEAGDMNLYVIDADGGVPRRLTREPSSDVMGTWSRDGRWIYFRSDRSGAGQIWKIPVEGGEVVQVTTGGGYYALESWDGRDVYYIKRGSPVSFWRVPTGGGEETEVLPVPGAPGRGLAVFRSGLYYSRKAQGQYSWQDALGESEYMINFFDFESGQVTTLFKEEGFIPWVDLAVSPDEEWILYGKHPVPVSELMLVENFR
jgi:Tol biopolymer transport system component